MDQLLDGVSANNGAGYDDGDILEEDDEVRDPNDLVDGEEEDLMIDEEDEQETYDGEKKEEGAMTTKSETIPGENKNRKNFMDINSEAVDVAGVSSSAVHEKGLRIQKKRSIPASSSNTGSSTYPS